MAALDPFQPSPTNPWNARRVAHLYNRLGFGASRSEIEAGLAMSPSDLVDQLLDAAAALPTPAAPVWANWTYSDYLAFNPDPNVPFGEHRSELYRRWTNEMTLAPMAVRAKMALFWSNVFVAEVENYNAPPYQWAYFRLLHDHAFGNFQVLAKEIGRSAAMLIYLNGNISDAAEPNENYARELMELFTMGENNGYTQHDIAEMARALTGWRTFDELTSPEFVAANWDDQPKTIFGQTGNFDFEAAHDLIFQHRAAQVAWHVPRKIYHFFVYGGQPDAEAVEKMGQIFQQNGWQILPMLRALFKSEHFFDEKTMRSQIKMPLESLLSLIRQTAVAFPDWTTGEVKWNDFAYWAYELNQEIFNPPNVAGWPGHRTWINENTLGKRWGFCEAVLNYVGGEEAHRETLRQMAIDLTASSKNAYIVTAAIVEHVLGQELDTIHFEAAVMAFKEGVPENYFIDGSWDLTWNEAPFQVLNLLRYLVRLPEFQLN